MTGIGRNDPCPCGSGQKYKKCCLVKPKRRIQVAFTDEALLHPWWVGPVVLFPTVAIADFYEDFCLSEAEVRFRTDRIYNVLRHLGWLRGDPGNILLDYVDDALAYAGGEGPPSDELLCGLTREIEPIAIPPPPRQPGPGAFRANQVVVILRQSLRRFVRGFWQETATACALKTLLHELTHAFGVMRHCAPCGARTDAEAELLTDAVVFESLPASTRTLTGFELAFEHVKAFKPELARTTPALDSVAMQAIVNRVRDAVRTCSADEEFHADAPDPLVAQ